MTQNFNPINMKWHIKHNKYCMIQWGKPIFFSLGIHVDNQLKYIDIHLIFIIITLGDPNWTYDEYSNAHHAWWSSRNKS